LELNNDSQQKFQADPETGADFGIHKPELKLHLFTALCGTEGGACFFLFLASFHENGCRELNSQPFRSGIGSLDPQLKCGGFSILNLGCTTSK
jgi:hypothetical protein